MGPLGHSRRFHFDRDGAGGVKLPLLGGGGGYMGDRADGSLAMGGCGGRRLRGEGGAAREDGGSHDDFGDGELRVECAGEAQADDGIGVEGWRGGIDCGGGAMGASAIGGEQDFMAAELGDAAPVYGDGGRAHLGGKGQEAVELHCIGRYQEKLHREGCGKQLV